MEIIFKNSLGASKGKQCEEFLSILKKLKFQISTKDKMLNFYVDKQKKRFIMTTFSNRNLEDPPAGSPLVFVDFEFGDDMFNLSSYAFDKPSMFSFDIEDLVKLTNHYYETKMSILKIQILSDFTNGLVQFEVPDEVQGGVPLVVQRLTQFPHAKPYQNKDHIDYFPLFELNDEYFEKLKEIDDIKYTCCYHIHQEGIYLKNYASKIQVNNYLLSKDDLFKYDSVAIKQKLRGNVYIQQADNYLIEEIKIAVKKHYKKMTVNLIVVRKPEQRQFVKFSYIQIEAHLALFPKTIKRIICNCEISSEINPEGFLVQQSVPQSLGNNLLKNQQPVLQGLRRVVFNRWAPNRATDYFDEKAQLQREREVQMQRRQIVEETKTRKIKYKLEDD